jgi:hypothetical protein
MYFVFMGSVWFLLKAVIISLHTINHLLFATVKSGVLFEGRTESLNNIKTSIGFKGLGALPDDYSGQVNITSDVNTTQLNNPIAKLSNKKQTTSV